MQDAPISYHSILLHAVFNLKQMNRASLILSTIPSMLLIPSKRTFPFLSTSVFCLQTDSSWDLMMPDSYCLWRQYCLQRHRLSQRPSEPKGRKGSHQISAAGRLRDRWGRIHQCSRLPIVRLSVLALPLTDEQSAGRRVNSARRMTRGTPILDISQDLYLSKYFLFRSHKSLSHFVVCIVYRVS